MELLKLLVKSFESDRKNPNDRYTEFLYHCYYSLDKNKKSKKMINKYINDKETLIKYIIANKEAITLELSK
tara:strand:+ start:301 stop:513 length:213 start_codon:yes stop_codon:yes gene_type:complete